MSINQVSLICYIENKLSAKDNLLINGSFKTSISNISIPLEVATDVALQNVKPNKTFYLAYDMNRVPHYHYHHDKFYPFETMELIDRETNIPQFNHISSEVSLK